MLWTFFYIPKIISDAENENVIIEGLEGYGLAQWTEMGEWNKIYQAEKEESAKAIWQEVKQEEDVGVFTFVSSKYLI